MHLLVTDRLACPRCGPHFGLVLMAGELRDRRVLEGYVGCSNCRERYPIAGGFADLRPSPRFPEPASGAQVDDAEGTMKLAAFLGVTEGPGLLLLRGASVRLATRLSAIVEGLEVLAADPALRDEAESAGVSRMTFGARFPFQTNSLRGVVLEGEGDHAALGEGIRVLAPGSRLVYFAPPRGAGEAMREGGLELLLEADSVLVGALK